MRAGLNEKHEPARLALLLGIASLRPPNQKRSDLFNPFSISPHVEDVPAWLCLPQPVALPSCLERSFPQILDLSIETKSHRKSFLRGACKAKKSFHIDT